MSAEGSGLRLEGRGSAAPGLVFPLQPLREPHGQLVALGPGPWKDSFRLAQRVGFLCQHRDGRADHTRPSPRPRLRLARVRLSGEAPPAATRAAFPSRPLRCPGTVFPLPPRPTRLGRLSSRHNLTSVFLCPVLVLVFSEVP